MTNEEALSEVAEVAAKYGYEGFNGLSMNALRIVLDLAKRAAAEARLTELTAARVALLDKLSAERDALKARVAVLEKAAQTRDLASVLGPLGEFAETFAVFAPLNAAARLVVAIREHGGGR